MPGRPTDKYEGPTNKDDAIVLLTAVACLGRKVEGRHASPKMKGIKLSAPKPGKGDPFYQMR